MRKSIASKQSKISDTVAFMDENLINTIRFFRKVRDKALVSGPDVDYFINQTFTTVLKLYINVRFIQKERMLIINENICICYA